MGVEGPNTRNEELQLRLPRGVGAFMLDYLRSAPNNNLQAQAMKHHTVFLDELLNIPHNLPVALMGVCCYTENTFTVLLIDCRGMRMQHERDGQETFDPFNLNPSVFNLYSQSCLPIKGNYTNWSRRWDYEAFPHLSAI